MDMFLYIAVLKSSSMNLGWSDPRRNRWTAINPQMGWSVLKCLVCGISSNLNSIMQYSNHPLFRGVAAHLTSGCENDERVVFGYPFQLEV